MDKPKPEGQMSVADMLRIRIADLENSDMRELLSSAEEFDWLVAEVERRVSVIAKLQGEAPNVENMVQKTLEDRQNEKSKFFAWLRYCKLMDQRTQATQDKAYSLKEFLGKAAGKPSVYDNFTEIEKKGIKIGTKVINKRDVGTERQEILTVRSFKTDCLLLFVENARMNASPFSFVVVE